MPKSQLEKAIAQLDNEIAVLQAARQRLVDQIARKAMATPARPLAAVGDRGAAPGGGR